MHVSADVFFLFLSYAIFCPKSSGGLFFPHHAEKNDKVIKTHCNPIRINTQVRKSKTPPLPPTSLLVSLLQSGCCYSNMHIHSILRWWLFFHVLMFISSPCHKRQALLITHNVPHNKTQRFFGEILTTEIALIIWFAFIYLYIIYNKMHESRSQINRKKNKCLQPKSCSLFVSIVVISSKPWK